MNEDKQLMIHPYMTELLKLENITDVKDVSGLMKLFGTIDIQVRSLKNLGYESDRYRPMTYRQEKILYEQLNVVLCV